MHLDPLDIANKDQKYRLESAGHFQLALFLDSPMIANLSIPEKSLKIADFVLRRSGAVFNEQHSKQITHTLQSNPLARFTTLSRQILKDLASVPITLEEFKTIEAYRAKTERRTHPTFGDR